MSENNDVHSEIPITELEFATKRKDCEFITCSKAQLGKSTKSPWNVAVINTCPAPVDAKRDKMWRWRTCHKWVGSAVESASSGSAFIWQWFSAMVLPPADQCDCWSLSDITQLNLVNSSYFEGEAVDPGCKSLWAGSLLKINNGSFPSINIAMCVITSIPSAKFNSFPCLVDSYPKQSTVSICASRARRKKTDSKLEFSQMSLQPKILLCLMAGSANAPVAPKFLPQKSIFFLL